MTDEEVHRRLRQFVQVYGAPRDSGDSTRSPSPILAEVTNHSCGDTVSVSLDSGGQGFCVLVRGCSICRAAGALAEQLIAPTRDGHRQCRIFIEYLNGGQAPEVAPEAAPEVAPEAAPAVSTQIHELALVRELPARRRCATLPFEALEQALQERFPGGVASR